MVLEMATESLFALVDVFFVSRVSADAVATVGVTESMLTIVYTAAMGLGIGATAVVARLGVADSLLAIKMGMGPRGVYIAMTVAFLTLAVVSGIIFRKGWWKARTV